MNLGFDYHTFRWLKRGPRRRRTLGHLAAQTHATVPTAIAKALRLPLSRTSDTLRELRKTNLVRVLNPRAHLARRYVITRRGRNLARKLAKPSPSTKNF